MENTYVKSVSRLFGKRPSGPLLDKLILRCTQPKEDFRSLGTIVADGPDGPTIHIDRGGDTLGVAHLDFVDWTKPRIKGSKIFCPQLDDRLGVWVLLDVLPALGIVADVLLTDSEECGRSTASAFDPDTIPWNWLFQFDRRGTDTVQYDYETDSMSERLAESRFKIGIGSFSDICSLEHLGLWGVNIGVGYHHEHTRRCYANLHDTLAQVSRFADFWRTHHATRFEHIPSPPRNWSSPGLWAGDDMPDEDDTLETYYDPLENEYRVWTRYAWDCTCGAVNSDHCLACDSCGRDRIDCEEFLY